MAYLAVHLLFLLLLLLLLLPSFMSAADSSYQSSESTDDERAVSTRWAVLVAGSRRYVNYRHQADVCHAYQVLKKGGLKDENIIVFMYDDIANHTENPRPGTIINNPQGKDVYAGVPKDYVGEDVNVNNFFAVLLGNKTALTGSGSGKVLRSGPGDHVFIFYSDHGGPSVISMPTPPYLYAPRLISVLKKMHASKSYKSLVLYVEACEAGSIFEGLLPNNISVLAVTASNAEENSFATYCPGQTGPDSPPPGYDVCLGDLFSVSWMEDSETHDLGKRTLKAQYDYVENRTSDRHTYEEGSHVMKYGDLSLNSQFLVSYVGSGRGSSKRHKKIRNSPTTSASQGDADLVYFWNKFVKSAEGSSDKSKALKELIDVMSHRLHVDSSVELLGNILFEYSEKSMQVLSTVRPVGRPLVDDWDCLTTMVRSFETYCGSLSLYGLKHTRVFANICNAGISTDDMIAASSRACREFPTNPLSSLHTGFSV